uniref:Uncharacterized protein n=1 Tax=Pinguiococcus pyrenoidosus TaxID=172671 RepID=A0A7R9YDV5_9STRA
MCVEVLENPDLKKKPVPSTAPPPNIQLMIRLGGAQKSASAKDRPLATHGAQSAVVHESLNLIEREIEIYRYTLGLPEYLHAILQRLRRFAKGCRSGDWRTIARGVADKADSASQQAKKLRSRFTLSPAESNEIEALLPKDTPRARERLERLSALQQKQKDAALGTGAVEKKQRAAKPKKRTGARLGEDDAEGDADAKERRKKRKTKTKSKAMTKTKGTADGAEEGEGAAAAAFEGSTGQDLEDEVGDLQFSDED